MKKIIITILFMAFAIIVSAQKVTVINDQVAKGSCYITYNLNTLEIISADTSAANKGCIVGHNNNFKLIQSEKLSILKSEAKKLGLKATKNKEYQYLIK